MSTRPWPEVKLVTRPPATAKPSHTRGRRMLALGLEEHQRVAPEVLAAVHHRGVEAAAHRRRAGDRIGTSGLADVDLDVDDRLGAVARRRHSRKRKMTAVRSIQMRGQCSDLLDPRNGAHTDLAGGILPGVLTGTGCCTIRGLGNDGHVGLDVDHVSGFLNSQDILIKLLPLYILHSDDGFSGAAAERTSDPAWKSNARHGKLVYWSGREQTHSR